MSAAGERVHIFGIRHHGPGSARSLAAALEHLQPDMLLVEGPPDAMPVLPLAVHEAMQPPVALLIYAPDDPTSAAYYPFAEFSPEWQAIRYGLARGIPVELIDLSQAVQMAMNRASAEEEERRAREAAEPQGNPLPDGATLDDEETGPDGEEAPGSGETPGATPEEDSPEPPALDTGDPLRLLAEAAGYSESEQWWEHLVEQSRDSGPEELFAAIREAMTALRDALPPNPHPIAVRREAAMRQAVREALNRGGQRIAVVCGAWHAPALVDLSEEKEDAALLKGLPKINVQATWVPWTNARLTRRSGYGAGIDSPGWYGHLWRADNHITERWMIHTARLLRSEDVDVSPASVIEAVRLAETLAALRDRPLPGLPELNEAALTVFCFGNPVPLQLVEEKLVVGEALGCVPPETPMAPLQKDFERETRRLRLPVEPFEKLLDLDLRKDNGLIRSHLLHRLTLLDVPWGRVDRAALQAAGTGRGGTFHEIWRLKWQPEFSVLLIEAGQWGNTIATAAASKACFLADHAGSLAALTRLVEQVLLANLPEAIQHVMRCLQAQAAVSSDIPHLMHALPPLASVMRYGNVRQTDTQMIAEVVDGLVARLCIGLPGACAALNDDAASEMFDLIVKVDDALNRLAVDRYREPWQRALGQLGESNGVHALLAGRACRILLDAGVLPREEAARRLGLGLSTASEPTQATAWIEGFLRGSGQLLIHDEILLGIIDGWLCGLQGETFQRLLPLLRRTFSSFTPPERRGVGERVKRGRRPAAQTADEPAAFANFDLERADAALPLAARLLGIEDL